MNKFLTVLIILIIAVGGFWLLKSETANAPTPTPSIGSSATPVPLATPTPSPTTGPAITITSPKAGALMDSPILVTGRARVFENQLTVEVLDSKGQMVSIAYVTTDAKDAGQYGNFSIRLVLPTQTATPTMTVEAFALSPKGDGTYQGFVKVPINIKYLDTMNVYAAFQTSNSCSAEIQLYPHEITKTSQFTYMAVQETLSGPIPDDKTITPSISTQIPGNVVINSFRISGSTAYVDFNRTLTDGITDTCRLAAIKNQITQALKQFLGINTVVITVNSKAF